MEDTSIVNVKGDRVTSLDADLQQARATRNWTDTK